MLMFRRRRSGSSFTSCTIVHKGLDAETGEDFDIAFDRIIPNLVTSKTFCLLDLTYISYHLFRLSDLNRGDRLLYLLASGRDATKLSFHPLG